ncbi:FAD/NAD(P)-binding domain-containing protein [Aspergillus steynii IBT 23096]|uniref:FAD/NAD(P)-binding domain-containing protein n=1 Tax=Aspergillus steynii IBT 23096 TaxID=1392250 RepID=A0A2I2GNA3_9EURO|nr:FAD/NAD(P)-binding domain-containing protein [Aspergillus steynii IBT 23096]PLB54371.1 FAD/NAD(P)-binding domain-containing protein [Aspergillus steynii IBT 23096]
MGESKRDVAVVGTGMAGLVTAYLLHHDPQQRFRVHLLDKSPRVSLSAESIAIPSTHPVSKKSAWADIPMRAFAGGYYHNLLRMYDHLGIHYRPQPFVFSFSRRSAHQSHAVVPYMVHASNFHQTPPIPRGDLVRWIWEAIYVLFFYWWFVLCCFFVRPLVFGDMEGESFDHYVRRIHLPLYYVDSYLLPMMSSVCTCSHVELRRFPASDIIAYKRLIHQQPHFVVPDGVYTVQEKLLRGLDVRLGVETIEVLPTSHGVQLTLRDATRVCTQLFDLVILAVSPDVAAAIFRAARPSLRDVPTTTVQTVAHTDFSTVVARLQDGVTMPPDSCSPQMICFCSNGLTTEAIHAQPNGILITTNPLMPIDPTTIIRSAVFTRVLRTPTSQRILREIFREDGSADTESQRDAFVDGSKRWRSGDDGVYLAGGWCWDGMVLLEGCVVSAMRVAADLDVEIPWI